MMANGEVQIVHEGPFCIYICVYIFYVHIYIFYIPYILVYLCIYSNCPVATSGIPRGSITSSISSYFLYRSGVCHVQIYPSISDTGEFLSLIPSQGQGAFERLTHKTPMAGCRWLACGRFGGRWTSGSCWQLFYGYASQWMLDYQGSAKTCWFDIEGIWESNIWLIAGRLQRTSPQMVGFF